MIKVSHKEGKIPTPCFVDVPVTLTIKLVIPLEADAGSTIKEISEEARDIVGNSSELEAFYDNNLDIQVMVESGAPVVRGWIKTERVNRGTDHLQFLNFVE